MWKWLETQPLSESLLSTLRTMLLRHVPCQIQRDAGMLEQSGTHWWEALTWVPFEGLAEIYLLLFSLPLSCSLSFPHLPIPPSFFNSVNQGIYWGYLKKFGWGVAYRSMYTPLLFSFFFLTVLGLNLGPHTCKTRTPPLDYMPHRYSTFCFEIRLHHVTQASLKCPL